MNLKSKKLWSLMVIFILAFSTILINTDFVWGRAGGGEDFGGGGFDSSSGGSSSSFDSNFGGSSWNSESGGGNSRGSTNCYTIFIFITIFIIVFAIAKRRGGNSGNSGHNSNKSSIGSSSNSSGGSSSLSNQSSDIIAKQLSELKKADPKFDEQKFKTYVKKVFMAVQKGWTEREQKVCRPFMAEEVYQSHQMQIDQMKKDKIINVLKKIVVGSVSFARVALEGEYDKITMKVRAAMTDYKVKEDTPNKIIAGTQQQSDPFTEYWVFIRKKGLKTKTKDGIFDRKCPNCGAPIKVDVAGVCKYCGANVVNGDFDWVLSEIIQKSEWS